MTELVWALAATTASCRCVRPCSFMARRAPDAYMSMAGE